MKAQHKNCSVLFIDENPKETRDTFFNGGLLNRDFSFSFLSFRPYLGVLARRVVEIGPQILLLGNGFGRHPFVGELFMEKLKQVGFGGQVVVCCQDTYMVAPRVDIIRADREVHAIRVALQKACQLSDRR